MRVLIANRGEVAVRIIRACEELGYTAILAHSTPDRYTSAFRYAHETIEIEGQTAAETYLDMEKIISAAQKTKANLLHPGFGFLSENALFVEKLEKTPIKFVGPPSSVIEVAGNKILAKNLAKKGGVPTVPSFTGTENGTTPEEFLKEAQKIGFPCIIKAASGGGGKGMKVAQNEMEFFELFASAQREAKAAFGSERVFIEKYLERPRHVEVQIFFDQKRHGVHLFERECSIQRRHQKIIEETPSVPLSQTLRQKITDAALQIGRAAQYVNAGTVEFLVDGQNFYFMELNTRLQVEHTVTEQVLGLDLVKWQFQIAQGKEIPVPQDRIISRGHALEARIYAENPTQEFLPSTGKMGRIRLPFGPHRRFDFGYESGDPMTPYYDPMIGKVITWAPTRSENVERMTATLKELVIFGVHTNIDFLIDVLSAGRFQEGLINTRYIEEEYRKGFKLPELTQAQKNYVQIARGQSFSKSQGGAALSYQSPWVTNS